MLAKVSLKSLIRNFSNYYGLMILLFFFRISVSNAQSGNCEPTVPFHYVDLTSGPSATFISPNGSRKDNCCSTSSPDRCVEFEIYLHPSSTGILFNIYSGAVPSGSMYYQINCGPMITVGQPVCLSGVGPHYLTFCKPGNNPNRYTIQSIPGAYSTSDVSVRMGCSINLQANGLKTSTIVWRDVTSGNGTYNSLLSCTSQCASPVFTPISGIPSIINYEVCGSILDTICNNYFYICDTVSVTVYPELQGVTPDTVYYCSNNAGINISANASGGNGVYYYRWLDSTGAVISTAPQYYASEGLYTLEIRDGYPNCPPYISQFRVMLDRLADVIPGSYPPVCVDFPTIQLNGVVRNISGGFWSGGTGNYSPDNDTLNAFYTPSSAEINAGTFTLSLTSYSDTVCPSITRQAVFSFTDPIIISTSSIQHVSCFGGNNGSLSVSVYGGMPPYTYSKDGNNFQTSSQFSSLTAGNYTITVRDSLGCTSSHFININEPSPLALQHQSINVSCFGGNNGSASVSVSGGISPYLFNWSNGSNADSVYNLTMGNYQVTVTDANGCTSSDIVMITEPQELTANALNSTPSCVGQNVLLSAVSNSGTVFNWSGPGGFSASGSNVLINNVTIASAGYYYVTVSDGTCYVTDSTQIVVRNNPVIVSGSDTSLCSGSVFQLGGNPTASGSTGPYNYRWYPSSGLSSDSVANPTLIVTGTTQYFLVVTDSFGCSALDTTVVILEKCDEVCDASKGPNILGAIGTFSMPFMMPNNSTSSTCIRDGVNSYSPLNNIAEPKTELTDYVYAFTTGDLVPEGRYTFLKNAGDENGPSCLHPNYRGIDHTGDGGYFMAINGSPDVGTYGTTYFSLDSIPVCPNTNYEFSAYILNLISGLYLQDSISFPNVSFYVNGVLIGTSGPIPHKPGFTFNDWMKSGGIWNSGNSNYASIRIDNANFVANGNDLAIDDISFNVCGPLIVDNTPPGPVCENSLVTITQSVNTQSSNQFTWYKWQMSSDGGTVWSDYSSILNETQTPGLFSASINIMATLAMDGYRYRLVVANDSMSLINSNSNCFVSGNPSILSVKSNPVVDAGNDKLICLGDTVIIGGNPSASGGTSPYNYNWSTISSLNNTFISNPTAYPTDSSIYFLTVTDFLGCSVTDSVYVNVAETISITGIVTNVSCFGLSDGSVDISLNGGIPPYSYIWSNGNNTEDVSSLPAGIYDVTVTDATYCQSISATFVINEPQILEAYVSKSDVKCYSGDDGSVDVFVLGGISPYNYLWNDSITSEDRNTISSGNYSVTISDANGCQLIKTITINEPDELIITSITSDVSCSGGNNGAIDLAVSGGNAPYYYIWSEGATTQDINSLLAGSYSVTVSDNNACSITNTIIINQPNPLMLSVNSVDISCYDRNDGSVSINVSGGAIPYSYNWSNGETITSINSLSTGNYVVTVTDNNNCIISGNAIINQPDSLDIISTYKNVSCFQSNDGYININVTGGNSPYQYFWSNNSTIQNQSQMYSGNYSVTVTDNNGCTKNEQFEVLQPESLTVLLQGTPLICQKSSNGNIYSSVSGGTEPYRYLWNNGNNASYLDSLVMGNYILTITDDNGCTVSDSFTINEYQYNADFNFVNNEVCLGEPIDAFNTSLSDNTITDLHWNIGIGVVKTGRTISHLFTVPGIYNIKLTITMQNGCFDTVIKPVIVHELPVADAGKDVSICPGESTMLNASGGAYYEWIPNNDIQPISQRINIVSPTDTSVYVVKVTNVYGCFDFDSVQVNVHKIKGLTISNDTLICPGAEVPLNVSGGVSYNWKPEFDLSCYQCDNPIASNLGKRTFIVEARDSNGCMVNDSVTITIAPLPSGIISEADSICAGNSIQLFAEEGHKYLWLPKDLLDDNEIFNPVATPDSTTTFTAVITNIFGCSVNDYVNIYVHPAPETDLQDTLSVCTGNSVQIYGNSQNNYSWTPTTGLSCSLCNNPEVSINISTLYVSKVTSPQGCITFDSVFVNVMPLPFVYAGDDIKLCKNDTYQFQAVNYGGSIFRWTPALGLSNPDILNPVIVASASSVYELEIVDTNGCINKDKLNIIVSELNVKIDSLEKVCLGNAVELNPSVTFSSDAGIKYTWTPSDLFANESSSNQLIIPVEDEKVTLIIESGNCKPDTQIIYIDVMPVPNVEAQAPHYVIANETFEITTSHFRANNFLWYPENVISCINEKCSKVKSSILTSTWFTVMVTDTNGCFDIDSVLVSVIQDCGDNIFIPNSFTPNGDEINDRFCIRSLELTGIKIFRIFNRWGQLIFETDDIDKCWDGHFNGKPVNPDVFVYYAEGLCSNGKVKLLKGNVTVLR
jgi:gliding motility-associated-like protein